MSTIASRSKLPKFQESAKFSGLTLLSSAATTAPFVLNAVSSRKHCGCRSRPSLSFIRLARKPSLSIFGRFTLRANCCRRQLVEKLRDYKNIDRKLGSVTWRVKIGLIADFAAFLRTSHFIICCSLKIA